MGIFTFQVFAFRNSAIMNIQIHISVYPFQVFPWHTFYEMKSEGMIIKNTDRYGWIVFQNCCY